MLLDFQWRHTNATKAQDGAHPQGVYWASRSAVIC